jgi:hypothetical protein
MMKNLFILAFVFSATTTVFAQEILVSESVAAESQNPDVLSPGSIDGQQQYPVCHRMKNGVVKHNIQAATTE